MTDSDVRDLLKKFFAIPEMVFVGTVKAVDMNTYSCTVEPAGGGAALQDVRLKAGVETEYTGLVEIPELGSSVLVGLIGNDSDTAYIVKCSKVEKIIINNGGLGGLVKIEELRESFDSIKDYIDSLQSAISSAFTSVGEASAASGSAARTTFEASMIGRSIEIKNMEDTKVTH